MKDQAHTVINARSGRFLRVSLRFAIVLPLISLSLSLLGQANPARELVDPFIGTGGHGHSFPGACVPNGRVQLSPDTRPDSGMDWDGPSSYHYSDSIIHGFSHRHLSGTGVSDPGDVLVTPFRDRPSPSRFDRSSEKSHAGYYAVQLKDPNVSVELTSTARVGVHRYSFKGAEERRLRIDLQYRHKLIDADIRYLGKGEIVGHRRSSSWAAEHQLFFCIQLSEEPYEVGELADADGTTVLDLMFLGGESEALVLKVGISSVSIEGARKNLEAEVPHWDFDQVRMEAEAAWNEKLNRIKVKGGTREQQRSFHTALYHCYVAPCIFNDMDGNYRGMDGQVHHSEHKVYTGFDPKDTYGALHPLMTLLEPEMTRDWIRSLLLHNQQLGNLSVQEPWAKDSEGMFGYHSGRLIADAYLKGIRGFDANLALEAMVATAEMDHFGLKAYRERGFISSEDESESVSRTLEYAYDDGCIARMADALGEQTIAERFHARSRNWQNLYDPRAKFFRPRRNGGFIEPFDPQEVNFHYTEANAWHYSLFVPHDHDRFIALLGNASGLTERLDALFSLDDSSSSAAQRAIPSPMGHYVHDRRASQSYAYLYTRSDRPMSTEVYVSKIMRELYNDRPDGLSGRDDHGQLSAWYVLSALGFYPLSPGIPEYSLGIPLFEEASVELSDGKVLRITGSAEANSRSHFVSSTWNGEEHDRFRVIDHGALIDGGHLNFELGPRPGSAPRLDQLEEMPDDVDWVPVPFIQAKERSFKEELLISIGSSDPAASLEFRLDSAEWQAYSGPITLFSSTQLSARAYRSGIHGRTIHSLPSTAHFVQVDGSISMSLQSNYAPEYAADGANSLLDGLRGGKDLRTREWQGFIGQDIVASLDLGEVKRVERLGIGVLQDIRSWIWYPVEVEFNTSTNGRQWSSTIVRNTVPADRAGVQQQDLWSERINKRARYIEITVRSMGPCPPWHSGAGKASWLFADEILIELE